MTDSKSEKKTACVIKQYDKVYKDGDRSVEDLYTACYYDLFPSVSTMADYFGIGNIGTVEKRSIMLGLYQYLVKYCGVQKSLLEACYMTGMLDDLIIAKHKHATGSGYFQKYIEEKMFIGKTPLLGEYEKLMDGSLVKIHSYDVPTILDDDHCPICESSGYLTAGNRDIHNYDCAICLIPMCKQCVSKNSNICDPCYTQRQNEKMCSICGKNITKYCSKCKIKGYCEKVCQKIDWKNHKSSCT